MPHPLRLLHEQEGWGEATVFGLDLTMALPARRAGAGAGVGREFDEGHASHHEQEDDQEESAAGRKEEFPTPAPERVQERPVLDHLIREGDRDRDAQCQPPEHWAFVRSVFQEPVAHRHRDEVHQGQNRHPELVRREKHDRHHADAREGEYEPVRDPAVRLELHHRAALQPVEHREQCFHTGPFGCQ